ARAGIVGQEKPDARQFEHVLVDRFQLVGEGVHAGHREAEIGVKLKGNAEGVGMDHEPQQRALAIETAGSLKDGEAGEVSSCERHTSESLCSSANHAEPPRAISGLDGSL